MLIRTKVLTIGLGITAFAGALFSFADGEGDDKKKKYHVIHQKDGELMEFDTILPMGSDYSVESFLADKGIESENVEIIKVPGMGQHMMFHGDGEEGEHRVIVKEFKHDIEIDGEEGESKEVKIMVEIDEDGKKVIQKWVDGEEVEVTEEELEKIEMHKKGHGMHGEEVIIKIDGEEGANKWIMNDGDHERVEIKVEIDDEGKKVITKVVDGKEVVMTEEELEKMHEGTQDGHGEHIMVIDMEGHGSTFEVKEGEGEEIRIEVEMDDEGNKDVKKWVNGEEVEMTEEDIKKMEMHQGHGENKMIFRMDNSNMTDEEKAELMEKMKDLHIGMDSLNGEMEINIETIIEEMDIDGAEGNVFIHRIETDGDHGHQGVHKMRMMHGGDEDFTIVLVHEDLTDEDIKSHTEVQRKMTSDEGNMVIFPNPNDGVFTIQFDQDEKVKTKIEIMDAQGKVVYSEKLGKFSGEYRKEINLKEHGAGMYIVNIQQGDSMKSHKIVVD